VVLASTSNILHFTPRSTPLHQESPGGSPAHAPATSPASRTPWASTAAYSSPVTTPRVFVALAFAAACALAGCSTPSPTATDAPSAEASARPSPKASSTPTPTPTPTPTSPLNGLPQPDQDEPSPVLVVKLDNTRFAQPHVGLDRADIVYIEEVEYGITRLAAVFSSAVPKRIGPVRSARITDIDLLDQYGSPAFSFSGAQRKMWPVIANASLIDISPNKAAFAYQRDFSRRAPYNYFVNGFEGLTAAPDASQARDIGLSFDSTPPPNGSVGLSARYEWSASTAEFTYDQASRLYRVSLNGRNAEAEETPDGQRAATVVIQYVKQEPSRFFDKGGGNTPHAITIGNGAAVVLRDGLMYQAKWSRPDAESGTTFTDDQGQVLAFKPGQQWIVLANRNVTATLFPTPPPPKDTDKSKESASDQSE